LNELGELKGERDTAQDEVATASRELRRGLATLTKFVTEQEEGRETPLGRYLAGLAAEPAEDWWAIVYPTRPTHETNADAVILLAAVDRVAAQDAASQLARQERQRNIAERDKLNEFRLLPRTVNCRYQGSTLIELNSD
jgi:hypothetical protein